MQIDTRAHGTWTAELPDGRRLPLDVAEGVRLCAGDLLRIGDVVYSVVRRQMLAGGAWLVALEPPADGGRGRRGRRTRG